MQFTISLVILIGAIPLYSIAQKVNISGENIEIVYRSSDSTQNYYVVLEPQTSPRGLLVILPGYGGPPQSVLAETSLPSKARKAGYLVVMPYLVWDTDCSDSISQSRLTTLIPEVIVRYKVPKNNVILGGHSIGGNGALLYAATAYRMNKENIIKPNLVFGVDPPLDIKRLYNSMTFFRRINFNMASVKEAEFFQNRFEKNLGGTPLEKPMAYEKISAYSRDAADGGNAKYLKSIPVRLYCDPDVNWFIENRRTPVEHTNLADHSACIVQLKLLGNNHAELITNPGKGYFADGRRHPHAFSQLDADEFLLWVSKMLASK